MRHELVKRLLIVCPFLEAHLDAAILDLPTVVFGSVARLLIAHELNGREEVCVFDHFNELADAATPSELEILGTGAIELSNDTAAAQRLAREHLKGRALALLEEYRSQWGQADYGTVG